MARKEKSVTIDAPGRDHGRTYLIKEMPAEQGEAWATRLMLALAKAGVEVPENFLDMGMAGVAVMGLRAMGGLSWDVAKPLMDEMMACVHITCHPGGKPFIPRPLISDDIEEIATRVRLREEVLEVHTGFSIRDFLSGLRKIQQEKLDQALANALGDDIETSQ
jgi:hypothetical protein